MSAADFVGELASLGYEPTDLGDGRCAIDYVVRLGRFTGETIRLGFAQLDTFPLNPPSTPHISPHLLPLHPAPDLSHPDGAVHASPFGDDWEYWSRPIADWDRDRSARRVLRHVSDLFAKIP
jgi:hypothetical protein